MLPARAMTTKRAGQKWLGARAMFLLVVVVEDKEGKNNPGLI